MQECWPIMNDRFPKPGQSWTARSISPLRFLFHRGLLCNSGGITTSYILSAGIYCPRQTDGDGRRIHRLGSRLRIHTTSTDSSRKYIRTYRMENPLIHYPSKNSLRLTDIIAAVHNPQYIYLYQFLSSHSGGLI